MIFGLKVVAVAKVLFHLGDAMVANVCKNNVINKYYQIDTSNIWVTVKNWMIYLTPSHT